MGSGNDAMNFKSGGDRDISDIPEGSECRALWASVLLQAIKDLDTASEAAATKFWMYRDTRDGVGSFNWICSVLDLDENRIATTCITREGRWRLLGPHYAGLHKSIEKQEKDSQCAGQKPTKTRTVQGTSKSRTKPSNSCPD